MVISNSITKWKIKIFYWFIVNNLSWPTCSTFTAHTLGSTALKMSHDAKGLELLLCDDSL